MKTAPRPRTERRCEPTLDQAARTLIARGPLGLVSIWNSTFSPPMRRSKSIEGSTPLRWKKYSFASSALMKPKPRSATTFLMVPVVTLTSTSSRTTTTNARSVREGDRPHGARHATWRDQKSSTHVRTVRSLTFDLPASQRDPGGEPGGRLVRLRPPRGDERPIHQLRSADLTTTGTSDRARRWRRTP